MKNYFTNIDLVEGQFIGTVYDSSNNSVVYKTIEYSDHSQALEDVNIYLKGTKEPVSNRTVQTATVPIRRCCGG
jgi:hypothetical protein